MSQISITNIAICNFRAFATSPVGEEIELPKGENLLVYGENGAGKSSLFLALKCFLESCEKETEFEPYLNLWHKPQDGWVKLTLSDGSTRSWPSSTDDLTPTPAIWIEANKIKGIIDYKAMLLTHFLKRNESEVDLFDLMVAAPGALLAPLQNPTSKTLLGEQLTIGETWLAFERATKKPKRTPTVEKEIINCQASLNRGVEALIPALEIKVNELLTHFKYDLTVKFWPSGSVHEPRTYSPMPGSIGITATYGKQEIESHQDFLNEAKLSALALSIFFAARHLEPARGLQLLALDDVLIGLDMSNRLHVLDLLEKHFNDYQIVITTYDRAWFDIVKRWGGSSGCGSWKKLEMFAGDAGGYDIPVIRGDIPLLDRAKKFFDSNDNKAAAVYARTHFEVMLKEFCADHGVPVKFCEAPKKPSANDLWGAVQSFMKDKVVIETTTREIRKSDGTFVKTVSQEKKLPILTAEVKHSVTAAKEIVLNPSAHADPNQPFAVEIMKAFEAINQLQSCLDAVPSRAKGQEEPTVNEG